jgi:hypothetical protein
LVLGKVIFTSLIMAPPGPHRRMSALLLPTTSQRCNFLYPLPTVGLADLILGASSPHRECE